ncbi:unnamed protein product, partial [Brassica rapa subsp. trilocularis]
VATSAVENICIGCSNMYPRCPIIFKSPFIYIFRY